MSTNRSEMQSETTVLEQFLRSVQKGRENAFEVIREALPDGKSEKVTVALQNRVLQPEAPKPPDRAESPRRSHVFHSMQGFCEYLVQYKTAKTVVFADVEEQVFYAVLDDTATRGFEIVSMVPLVHPLWQPWNDILNKPMPVKDFAKFLLTNRRQLAGERAKDLIADFSQVRAAADISLEVGVGKDRINGLVIHTKIQGSKGEETFDLPDMILIRMPLFVGLDREEIEIDILLEPADPAAVSGVNVTLTSADATTKTIAAFELMCDELRAEEELACVVVVMGHPYTEPWEYI